MCLLVATVVVPDVQRASAAPVSAFVRLSGSVVPVVAQRRARTVRTSASEASQPLTLTLVLNRSDQAGFDRYLANVQNPDSASYRHFLTQQELADRFGPSQTAYDSVLGWLRMQGFALIEGSANRLTLTVRGTRGQADSALGAAIGDFQLGHRVFYANRSDPRLPVTISPYVESISGLSNFAQPTAPHSTDTTTPTDVNNACNDAYNTVFPGPFSIGLDSAQAINQQFIWKFSWLGKLLTRILGPLAYLYALYQIVKGGYCIGMTAGYYYNHPPTPLGPGSAVSPLTQQVRNRQVTTTSQKIGLLEFDTFHVRDVQNWLALLGADTSMTSRLHEVSVNGGVRTPGLGESEVLLDIDTVMSIDPSTSASYVVYDAPNGTSYEQLFNAMINDGNTVISNSWTECEDQVSQAGAMSIDSVLAQAAASGITVFNATGDSGSTCWDGSPITIGVPADSPHATAVGGTSPRFGPAFTYGSETWWGARPQSVPSGSGGFGVSRYFSRPSFQDGLTSSSMRSIPDVAIDADPSAGLNICQADSGGCPNGLLYGGTSMAAPEMAAFVAVLNQAIGFNVGQFNATLYSRVAKNAFHSPASMGSDFAHVGLGSPNFNSIQLALSRQSVGPVSPSMSVAGASTTVPADGLTRGVLRVDLLDSHSYPVAGREVSLTPNSGSHAVIPSSSGPSSVNQGAVTIQVTDSVPETVTFTVKDTTDDVTVSTHPTIQFVPPPATGGRIDASIGTVPADGTSTSTITVTLQNAKGQGAQGKQVTLSEGAGHAVITPTGATPEVTDKSGTATFTVADPTAETVTFSATDETDGQLPVPGTARVTFGNNGGGGICSPGTITPASSYKVSTFATGYPTNSLAHLTGCGGPDAGTWDAEGNLYVPDIITGDIYKFGPNGGAAGSHKLTSTPFGSWLVALATGKNGDLYALQTFTNDSQPGRGDIYQIDPSTGSVIRKVADNILGPTSMTVDPISGDLFVGNGFNGGPTTGDIVRVHDPGPGQPTVDCINFDTNTTGCTAFATPGQVDSLAFDSNGTLYARGCGVCWWDNGNVWSITGTNSAHPGTVTLLTNSLPGGGGIAVVVPESHGKKAVLATGNQNGSELDQIDLNQSPLHPVPMVTGLGGAAVGPDGCLYGNHTNSTYRITSAEGSCPFAPAIIQPALALSQDKTSVSTGSPVTFTATLLNVDHPQGTRVLFTVNGANPQVKLVPATANGTATFTYTGVFTGKDTVTASAVTGSTTLTSPVRSVSWTAGRHVIFAGLNLSPGGGMAGSSATLKASLTDISASRPAPIVGAHLTIALGKQSCNAITDRTGMATCSLTLRQAPGMYVLTARYLGDGQRTPATATSSFTITKAVPFVTSAPPTTTASLSGTLVGNAVFTGPVTLTLTASNPRGSTSAITSYYSTDGGKTWHTYNPSARPVFTASGQYTVDYYSSNGSREATKAISFTIVLNEPDLCTLTKRYVTNGTVAVALCSILRTQHYAGYIALIHAYRTRPDFITPANADFLTRVAQQLERQSH